MPIKQRKLIEVWAMLHEEDLLTSWALASEKLDIPPIEPLR